MRLSEIFLSGFEVNTKNIRPTQVLDIIEGLLITVSDTPELLSKALENIKDISGSDFNGSVSNIRCLANDKVLVKLLGNQIATKLYLKLLVNILVVSEVLIHKDVINEILEGITNQNAKYKALTKAVDTLNNALDDTIILYTQYSDKVKFTILKGTDEISYRKSLEYSGSQSPAMIDKLQTVLIQKGII